MAGIRTPISQELFHELVHYFKYASSAYVPLCPRPNGKHLVSPLVNPLTDIQGYIARDDDKKELVVALRGSVSVVDFLTDVEMVMVPFMVPMILPAPPDSKIQVHSGFLMDWISIAAEVVEIVKEQLHHHRQYKLVTVGHSLGGALATLAALTLKLKFPENQVRTYSYGSPRVGNKEFAEFVNRHFGKHAFRVVHTDDGVPTIIPTSLGYHHHAFEYWETRDPPACLTTVQCSADGEDQACSASVPSMGFTPAHTVYLGIFAATPFCL
ncbi:alpha/beta-hydrolase [Amanita rubescens]|nr:alpha/beta-hydrolase [Amanita rubescens]